MKSLALAVGALIAGAGLGLILFPAVVIWLAHRPLTPFELYGSAVGRMAIGVLFLAVARSGRVPWMLRLFGTIAIIAGAATVVIGVDRARAIADWTTHQGVAVVRMFGLLPLVLGALVVYACGPVRRAV